MKKRILLFIGVMLVMPLHAEKKDKHLKGQEAGTTAGQYPMEGKSITAAGIVKSTDVVTEEYIPEVIIEAKWGTGEGEFGMDGAYAEPGFPPMYANEMPLFPKSLAVDSKGNIYILDVVNNRMQKFNESGKYLKSIVVQSWRGYFRRIKNGEYIKGINIVIDSEDNLYYYCIRKDKGKETGEVWMFRDDKLKEKREVPYAEDGLELDTLDNSVWITDVINGKKIHYNVKEKREYKKIDREEREVKIKKEYQQKGVQKIQIKKRGSPATEPVSMKITDEGLKIYKVEIIKKKEVK